MDTVKIISDTEARQVLEKNYTTLFDRLETTLGEYSTRSNKIIQPLRSCLSLPERPDRHGDSCFLTMPAYSDTDHVISTKLLSIFPANRPSIQATVVLMDGKTGSLLAVLDGAAITEIRTAMASAVAMSHLTTSSQRRNLAILGSGVQARSHADVFKAIFNFNQITVWSRNFTNAKALAQEKGLIPHESIEEAVKDADIIVTATNSEKPILRSEWIKDTVCICSVGACDKNKRELADDIMTSSVIITDTREGALAEAGDIIQTNAKVTAEIGEIINGLKVELGRRIVFKSLGMAVEDTVAAKLVYEKIST